MYQTGGNSELTRVATWELDEESDEVTRLGSYAKEVQ